MPSSFDTITAAVETARSQFSVLGKQEDNAEVLKEMSVSIIKAISGLVHQAGGDNDYLEGWIDGVSDDIDHAFRDQLERKAEMTSLFRPHPCLLAIVRGADMQGRVGE